MERIFKELVCDKCGYRVELNRIPSLTYIGEYEYEEPPSGWVRLGSFIQKDLCPACSAAFTSLVDEFFEEDVKHV